MLFKDALTGIEGIDIFGFTDPTLALEHFVVNHAKYEVVISDFKMPGMNGVELLKEVKNIRSDVRTLLISAFGINDDLFGECSCVDKVLQKPIHMSKLIDEIGLTPIQSQST